MKKFIAILCMATLISTTAEARHFGGHHHIGGDFGHHTLSHKHHHGNTVAGFVAGLIGGTILNYAINQPRTQTVTTSYSPTVVSSPVVNTQVLSTPTVVTQSNPCYTTTNLVTGQTTTQCPSIITSAPTITQITSYY